MRIRLSTLILLGILACLHRPDLPLPAAAKWVGAAWLCAAIFLVPAGFFAYAIRTPHVADRVTWAGMPAMES